MDLSQLTAEDLRSALVKLQSGRMEPGIRHEPRAFYDVIPLDGSSPVPSHGEVFKNAEDWPVRLTKMVAMSAPLDQDGEFLFDETLIQRIGIRFFFHDANFQNPEFLSVGAYANTPVASPQGTVQSTSAWKHDVPYILSTRDTLLHTLQALLPPPSPVRATITHTGMGFLSGRPYILTGFRDFLGGAEIDVTTRNYRNDGGEPIVVSDVTLNGTSPEADDEPTGDTRFAFLNVKQVSNGTQQFWCQGPSDPPFPLMPAALFGAYSGRAVVHTFPGDGLIWEPGQGLDLEAISLNTAADRAVLWIALLGCITVS